MFKILKNQNAISLINVLVGITIIIIAFLGIWNMFNFSLKIVAENKFRTIASAIATEKLETIRNLSYDDIGTVAGIPAGAIPQTDSITRNSAPFTVTTKIFYIDDPYDNLVPDDLLGADYKKIKISVDWAGRAFAPAVTSYSTISPKGVETDVEGGTIRIIVFNASGQAIPSADVQIINTTLDPVINITSITDQSGILLRPGSPVTDDKSYEITASKTGYTTDKTYPETDETEATKPHVQVLEDQIAEKSLTIDLVSAFNITTIGKDYPANWKINTASTSAEQLAPDVAIDASNYYYFVWQDNKDTGSFRIYAQKYSAGRTAQWSPDKRIVTSNNQVNPRIAADNTNLYITWNDDREGNQNSYLIKLDSAGDELWASDKKMGSLNQNDDQTFPGIAISKTNGASFIAFQENSGALDDWDIYIYKYDADGDPDPAWPNAIKVNDDVTTKNQNFPQIAFYNDAINDDQVIYITWQDFRNDNWDIYAHKFNATGTALWESNIKINTDVGSANQTAPEIALDSSGNIYITWQDNRNTNWDIYAHKYQFNGTAVWLNEIKINQNIDTANQTQPAIAVNSSDQLFISWTDERYIDTRGQDIYAQKFDANGIALWADDELIIYNDETESHQENSQLAIDTTGYAIITWQDSRDEDTDIDIFSARYQGPGGIIAIPNIPINIKGTKQIYDTPVILKYDNNFTTDGSGTLTLTDIEWDSYTIEPQATSSYTLISSDPPQPIIINPDESIDVELNIE